MDETGIMEGLGLNGLVLGNSEKKVLYRKSLYSRIWTTIIECISAAGTALPPLVIFKGKHVQQQWIPDQLSNSIQGWQFTASPNGWTSNEIALGWLKDHFVPLTHSQTPSPRLLIVDGHGSHVSEDFMYECFKSNIHLLFLPPHSSHVLQPLDVSIFSPLKSKYKAYLSNLITATDCTPINKRGFMECYYMARKHAMVEKIIQAGWRGSGLWDKSLQRPNIKKPLNDPLVFQESATNQPKTSLLVAQSPTLVLTPRKGSDVRRYTYKVMKYTPLSELPINRLLFQKIGKAIDSQNTENAMLRQQISSLKAIIEAIRPQRRRRVYIDPK